MEDVSSVSVDETPPEEESKDTIKKPFLLDLNALESPELPVIIGEKTYYMLSKDDMSMSDREELRLILVQIAGMQDAAFEDLDKTYDSGQRTAYSTLEKRLVVLAFGRDLKGKQKIPQTVVEDLSVRQRNSIIEAFFNEVDVNDIIRSFAATMKRMKTLEREKAAKPDLRVLQTQSGMAPLPPDNLLGPLRSSTTTAKSAPTSS